MFHYVAKKERKKRKKEKKNVYGETGRLGIRCSSQRYVKCVK